MKDNISNTDKNGHWHGVQIWYDSNGNIEWIWNYHHGKLNGYRALFKSDKSIHYKEYWNMDKIIYEEDHWLSNQIEIKI